MDIVGKCQSLDPVVIWLTGGLLGSFVRDLFPTDPFVHRVPADHLDLDRRLPLA